MVNTMKFKKMDMVILLYQIENTNLVQVFRALCK